MTGPRDDMIIAAVAPWFGGKRTLGPTIAAELGRLRAYWEPFCGSLAVLFAIDPPVVMETVNDLHGDLINLVRVLASDRCEQLWSRTRRTVMADELFAEAKAFCDERDGPADCVAESVADVADEHVERAYWFLVYSWQGRNGVSGTRRANRQVARRFTAGGGAGGRRWASMAESLPAWHERLGKVHVSRIDGIDVCRRVADRPGNGIYADPPYIRSSRSKKGTTQYVHDFTDDQHAELAEALGRFRAARVVVSYYDHPDLERLYPPDRWMRLRPNVTKGIVNAGRRDGGGAVKAPEVLLINGPSYTAAGGQRRLL